MAEAQSSWFSCSMVEQPRVKYSNEIAIREVKKVEMKPIPSRCHATYGRRTRRTRRSCLLNRYIKDDSQSDVGHWRGIKRTNANDNERRRVNNERAVNWQANCHQLCACREPICHAPTGVGHSVLNPPPLPDAPTVIDVRQFRHWRWTAAPSAYWLECDVIRTMQTAE